MQKISHTLFGHQKSGCKSIRPLLSPRLSIVSTRNSSRLIAVHKRVTVFMSKRKLPPHWRLIEISQNRQAKIGTTQKKTRNFILDNRTILVNNIE